MEIIIANVTVIITWILGHLSKKCDFINNNVIVLQNIFVGLFSALIYYVFTKDFSEAIAFSGIFAETGYNLVHNISKLVFKGEE